MTSVITDGFQTVCDKAITDGSKVELSVIVVITDGSEQEPSVKVIITDGSCSEPSVMSFHRRFLFRTVCDSVFSRKKAENGC